jgi:nucleoside-diphosphate-sugar epimerase
MSIICVTGATGLIGSHVCKLLLEKGHEVHACVRDPTAPKVDFLRKLARSEPCSKGILKLFKADLNVKGSYEEAMIGCSVCIHTASPVQYNFVKCPFDEVITPCVEGSRDVARTAKKCGVTRFVNTGSVASISQLEENREPKFRGKPFCEDEKRFDLRPRYATYQLAKSESEQVVYKEFDEGTVISILPVWVLGEQLPTQPSSSHTLIKAMAVRELPMSPLFYTSWVSVEDCSAAMVLSAFCDMPDGHRTRRYIVSQGDVVMAQDFSDSIRRQFSHLSPPSMTSPWIVLWLASFVDKRIGPYMLNEKCVKREHGHDGSRITKELGFEYKDKSLDPCVKRAVDSMIQHGNVPSGKVTQ